MILGSVPLSADDRARLADYVARAWVEHARAAGAPITDAEVGDGGELCVLMQRPRRLSPDERDAVHRALESLARVLEDLGYAIDRRGSARVVTGWATVDGIRVVNLELGDTLTAYTNMLSAERERDAAKALKNASDPRGPKVLHAMRVAGGGR